MRYLVTTQGKFGTTVEVCESWEEAQSLKEWYLVQGETAIIETREPKFEVGSIENDLEYETGGTSE